RPSLKRCPHARRTARLNRSSMRSEDANPGTIENTRQALFRQICARKTFPVATVRDLQPRMRNQRSDRSRSSRGWRRRSGIVAFSWLTSSRNDPQMVQATRQGSLHVEGVIELSPKEEGGTLPEKVQGLLNALRGGDVVAGRCILEVGRPVRIPEQLDL